MMNKLSLALKVLFNNDVAAQLRDVLSKTDASPKIAETPSAPPEPSKPARSEAITLLATLQREARLVDFLMEKLDGYSDAQVGAAVRDVQRDSRTVLERLMALRPVLDQTEGSQVGLSAKDHSYIRRTGSGDLEQAETGQLVHHGWKAAQCELPQWTGAEDAQMIVTAAEVEVQG